jgi:hypothetical protein
MKYLTTQRFFLHFHYHDHMKMEENSDPNVCINNNCSSQVLRSTSRVSRGFHLLWYSQQRPEVSNCIKQYMQWNSSSSLNNLLPPSYQK